MKRILTFSASLLCSSLCVAGDWDAVYPGPAAARVVETVSVGSTPTAPMLNTVNAQPTPIIRTNPFTKLLDLPVNKAKSPVMMSEPISVYSGTTIPMVPNVTTAPTMVTTPSLPSYLSPRRHISSVDLTQPLPNILTAPLPTTPTVSYSANSTCNTCSTGCVPCGTPLFQPVMGSRGMLGSRGIANGVVGMGSLPSMDRLKHWIGYQPGPSGLPVFVPTPYHAPVRAYFPCTPNSCANQGPVNCYPAHDRNAVASSGSVTPAATGDCTSAACRAPIAKGFGLFARPSSTCATTGSIGVNCAPVAVPLPASCVGSATPTPCGPRACGSVLDRMLSFFTIGCGHNANAWACPSTTCNLPNQAGCNTVAVNPPTATVPVIMGYTQPVSGYRFANPVAGPGQYAPTMQPVSKAPPTQSVEPAVNAVAAANRPFTNP